MKLLLSDKYNYAINLNKQEPSYKLLYNLFKRELNALQMYLNNIVKKR